MTDLLAPTALENAIAAANAPAAAPMTAATQPRDAGGKFAPKASDGPKSIAEVEAANPDFAARLEMHRQRMEREATVALGEAQSMPPIEAKPVATKEGDAATEAAKGGTQEQPPAEKPKDEVIVDKEAHAAALAAAKRLKIPAKAIEAMSPAELVQAGKDWQEQIASNGSLSRELGELRKLVEASKASKETAPAKAGQPVDDLDAALQPFVAKLDVDEETGKTLGEMLKAVDARNRARIETLEAQLGEIAKDRTLRVVQETRGKLLERFPQLGDDTVFEDKVLTRAAKLLKSGEYSLTEAIEHSAMIELPPPAPVPPQPSPATTASKHNSVAVTDSGSRKAQPVNPWAKAEQNWLRAVKEGRA